MLDLRRLRLLRELAARGTLAAVAEALSYSPSSVSQQLSELEREAGVVLLERAGRGVRLTDAAYVLVEHAEALLTRMERAEAELAATAGAVVGRVSVASVQTAAATLLPAALADLADNHPAVRVEVRHVETDESLQSLALGQVDLVVGIEYDHVPQTRHAGIEREHLFSERLLVGLARHHPRAPGGGGRGRAADRGRSSGGAANPPGSSDGERGHAGALTGRPIRLASLSNEAWAAGYGAGHAALVNRACNLLGGFEPDIRHRSDDLLVLRALVASGQAVTLLPERVAASDEGRVVLRPIVEGKLRRQAFTATRAGSLKRPALAAVRDAIHGAVRTTAA
jgi:DNA-binding transcriptional LysR family regulator